MTTVNSHLTSQLHYSDHEIGIYSRNESCTSYTSSTHHAGNGISLPETSPSISSALSVTSAPSQVPSDLYIPRSEPEKRELLLRGPNQPRSCCFPKTSYSNGRLSFQTSWYDMSEARGWLEYSEITDIMYCMYCRLFGREEGKDEQHWARVGVCNWKKATEKIRKHHKSLQHRLAHGACESFLIHSCRSEDQLHRQELEDDRQYLARLVDVSKTLAKCGLAFRGHDETANSLDKGNFREIVDLLARWDPILSDYIERAPRNCTYLSNRSQNDIIKALGEVVLEEIIRDIKSAGIYSVMMDETTDTSGKEQASVIVRFVDQNESL